MVSFDGIQQPETERKRKNQTNKHKKKNKKNPTKKLKQKKINNSKKKRDVSCDLNINNWTKQKKAEAVELLAAKMYAH